MHRIFLLPTLVAALLLNPVSPVDARQADAEVEILTLDPELDTQVLVSQRVWAKERPRGLAKLLPSSGALVILPGTYRVELGLRAEGREWLLVPYQLRVDGVERSPDTSMSVVSGCSSRFRRFLALDRASLQFEPRIWRVHYHRCTDGLVEPSVEGEWSKSLDIQEPGRVAIRAHGSANDAIAAMQADAAREQAVLNARAREEQARAPLKRQIGARLCKIQGDWEFVGFTEAVSPDSGKIKVRIVDQLRVGASNLRAGGFQERITWEHPDQWTLCE